ALSACPAPTGSRWRTRPSTSSSGVTAATCSSGPPTMIVRLPASAPLTPPETGASTRVAPRAATSSARERVRSGSEEPMSTSTVPGASASTSPVPRTTASTTFESGSIRITAPTPSATSAAFSTNVTTSASPGLGAVSWPRTDTPAAASLRAMGPPIRPRPMNPTAPGSPALEASGIVGLGGELGQDAFGHAERLERGGDAAVDRRLQQRFLDLLLGGAVGDRPAHVHAQLVVAAERGEHDEVEQAAGAPVQAGPAPDVAPAGAGDELLHRAGEVAHRRQGPFDVGLAQHLLAVREPLQVALVGGLHRAVALAHRIGSPFPAAATAARYSSSPTSSSHTVGPSDTARCVMIVSVVPPCQWRSPGGHHTTSPARISCGCSPWAHTQPRPAVTT